MDGGLNYYHMKTGGGSLAFERGKKDFEWVEAQLDGFKEVCQSELV